jgi:DNA-binding GntR family transcriptional regulator
VYREPDREGEDDMTGQDVAYRSLPEHVYESVRERILSGELQGGQRLKERDISDALNVSRIPVREALQLLEASGFVRVIPRRGAIVNELTERDVDELFDVRESLEPLAARLAAEKSAPESLAVLERVLQESRSAVEAGDGVRLARSNLEFHAAVVRAADNRLLETLMRGILERMAWVFRTTADRDMRVQCAEHENLVSAIRAGRVELAGSLAYAHVASGREPSVTRVRERETDADAESD